MILKKSNIKIKVVGCVRIGFTFLISNLVSDLSNCDPRIQVKMIALADEADEEYGRRLREGLAQASTQGSSQKPLGNRDGDKAPDEAVKKGHDADPY